MTPRSHWSHHQVVQVVVEHAEVPQAVGDAGPAVLIGLLQSEGDGAVLNGEGLHVLLFEHLADIRIGHGGLAIVVVQRHHRHGHDDQDHAVKKHIPQLDLLQWKHILSRVGPPE